MTDIVLGFAANYDWPAIEPYAVSLVRSGFAGKKVLIAQNLTELAVTNLRALDFELLPIPSVAFSDPKLPLGNFFAYVGRFLLIHQYLYDNPDYRFVICADTRDVVFQHDPIKWLEYNIRDDKIVAAPEYILHENQEGNALWIQQGFKEIEPWLMPKMVYCSGLISGRAEYISDLALAIYMTGRSLSDNIWGVDQPAYNTVMHQKAYADATYVPKMSDQYCLHMVVLAFSKYRKLMTELPPVTETSPFTIVEDGETYAMPDLSGFAILHQYDRILPLAEALRKKYSLAV